MKLYNVSLLNLSKSFADRLHMYYIYTPLNPKQKKANRKLNNNNNITTNKHAPEKLSADFSFIAKNIRYLNLYFS